ncbi:MAG: glycosyltransferase family 39 protein [Bacteroidales bacterium]|nr:glycosyltransferase family 39 protein [Bacteroidales bacterium]
MNDIIKRVQKMNYFPAYSARVFIVLFLALSFIYGYHNILFKPPQGLHLWRQADCLSMTKNFYEDNLPFFEPAVHNLGRDGTGKTVSDFPLIYYSVAKLWKIFGPHEFIFRGIVLILFFFGLLALLKLIENILKDSVLALISVLLLFTSPTLAYYANNFLMNVPAFSLALLGLYFFFRYYHTSSEKYFYFLLICYTLGGLLKIPALLSFMAIGGLFVLELAGVRIKAEGKIFRRPVGYFLLFLAVPVIQAAWYLYAAHYNNLHNKGFFLVGILPVWEMDREQVSLTLEAIRDHIKWDYFRRETQVVLVVMLSVSLFFFRKMERMIFMLLLFLMTGLLAFVILFFNPLKDHDYYTVNLFILAPVTMLGFFLVMKAKFRKIYDSPVFRILLVALLIHSADFARRRMEARYDREVWYNQDYYNYVHAFTEIEPCFEEKGIRKEDRVLNLSDQSINITLYIMDRKGWTNFGLHQDSMMVKEKIGMGAKFLFLDNNAPFDEGQLRPFLKKPVGRFRNIDIYAL